MLIELLREAIATPEIVAGFFGAVVVPFAVEIVKSISNKNLKRWVAWIISFGTSAIVGFVTLYVKGDLVGGEKVLESIGYAFIASQAIYELVWKPVKLDERVESTALKLFRKN